jgi:ABC-type bacteriocin/lantibiotic exporter with double-glycine peptidase domain
MPTALSIVSQRTAGDCAVACLAMLLGLSYERVFLAFRRHVEQDGASVWQIQAAAERLHRRLRWRTRVDLETSTGIVWLHSAQWPDEHVVILKDGHIITTDQALFDADVYLSVYRATVTGILVLVEA